MLMLKSPHPFELLVPQDRVAILADSPHSGRDYPADFNPSVDETTLARYEDRLVDQLIEGLPSLGITTLCAQTPRTYIDFNRAPTDVHPHEVAGCLEDKKDLGLMPTHYGKSGLGLIWTRPFLNTHPLYTYDLTPDIIKHRVEEYHAPYHQALSDQLSSLFNQFGKVLYLDFHSMPAESSANDFVLGDRDGHTCDPRIRNATKDFLASCGYKVGLNSPYRGAELVKRHSLTTRGRHALQIEISRRLYLEKDGVTPSKHFDTLKDVLYGLGQHLVEGVQCDFSTEFMKRGHTKTTQPARYNSVVMR